MRYSQEAIRAGAAGELRARHRPAIERVIIEMRGRADAPLSLEAMAEIACMSPFHFSRVFRLVAGVPPGEFMRALRMEHAKRLLLTTDLSVTELCYEAGFESLGTFTTRFTQLVGVPPGGLRRVLEQRGAGVLPPPGYETTLPAIAPGAGSGAVIAGTVRVPEYAGGPIYVGVFPSGIAQRRPVAGALLAAPGRYALPPVPAGTYYLLAANLPPTRDLLESLLPAGGIRVAAGPGALEVRDGRVLGCTGLAFRAPLPTDPPILVALPALLLERATVR